MVRDIVIVHLLVVFFEAKPMVDNAAIDKYQLEVSTTSDISAAI
jgi:hypothetical protein